MLFKSTIRLVDFAKLASTINFQNVKPTIGMVEEQFIIPVIGETLYNDLNTAYTAALTEDLLSSKQMALLEKVRKVIGPLVCNYYLPSIQENNHWFKLTKYHCSSADLKNSDILKYYIFY